MPHIVVNPATKNRLELVKLQLEEAQQANVNLDEVISTLLDEHEKVKHK